jgi:protein TIF31
MDDGVTIQTEPNFSEHMKVLGERLHLSPSKVLDGAGTEHLLYGGVDTKGIKGSDSRKYILESMRVTPRDCNFLGDDYALCLVRPELIDHYQQVVSREYVERQVAETNERKASAGEETKLTMEELREILKTVPKAIFNPNVYTRYALAPDQEADAAKVTELCRFLKETQLPLAAKALTEEGGWTRYGTSLVDALHSFGVNARYLGEVSRLITKYEHKHMRWMCERTVLARTVKHIFNRHMRSTSDLYLAETLTELLNSLFELQTPRVEERKDTQGKRKSRKKKKPQVPQPKSGLITVHKPAVPSSAELWAEVMSFAKQHFDLDLPQAFSVWEAVALPGLKLSFLSEVCREVGIQLENKPISLSRPIEVDSVAGVTHKVKALRFKSQESKLLQENAAQAFNEQNIELGLEMLSHSVSIQAQISGYLSKEIAFCYQRMSQIMFSQGDFAQGLGLQHKSIIILERVLGLDHPLVAQSYGTFAFQYQALGKLQRGVTHLLRSIQLYTLNSGEVAVEIVPLLFSLSVFYRELRQHVGAINVLNRVLQLCVVIYGEQHINVAECYSVLANEYRHLGDSHRAVQLQSIALETYKASLAPGDKKLEEAATFLEQLKQLPSAEVISPDKVTRSLKSDRNALLRQKLKDSKSRGKGGRLENEMGRRGMGYSQEQIEEIRTQQLIEEIQRRRK